MPGGQFQHGDAGVLGFGGERERTHQNPRGQRTEDRGQRTEDRRPSGSVLCPLSSVLYFYMPLPCSWSWRTCSPHSFLAVPDQRPARSSSPVTTARVHGQQPMLG